MLGGRAVVEAGMPRDLYRDGRLRRSRLERQQNHATAVVLPARYERDRVGGRRRPHATISDHRRQPPRALGFDRDRPVDYARDRSFYSDDAEARHNGREQVAASAG